jgi:hypothetical protein
VELATLWPRGQGVLYERLSMSSLFGTTLRGAKKFVKGKEETWV